MEYIYAALLLHKAGKEIDEGNLKSVLSAAGVTPDEARVKALVAVLSEVNIDEALKAAPGLALAAAPTAPTQPAEKKEEKKKEEKKEEKGPEEALEGLGALFG